MAKFCHNSGHAVSLTQFLFNLLSTLIHSRYCFLWCPFVSFHFLSIFLIHDFSVWYIWPLSIFSISPLSLFCSNFLSSFYIFCSCPPSNPASVSFVQINKVSPTSVTRLGDYWKFPTINCLTKVAQIFWTCMGFFENVNLFLKTAVANFWTTFGENWATF